VQADVKLQSASAEAGLCLRIAPDDNAPYGDRFYELHLIGDADPQQPGQQPKLQFRYRYYQPGYGWQWYRPVEWSWGPVQDPTGWHTLAVVAIENTFECYLDGTLRITVTDYSPAAYQDGLVGLWVESNAALFDNVVVLDLRSD